MRYFLCPSAAAVAVANAFDVQVKCKVKAQPQLQPLSLSQRQWVFSVYVRVCACGTNILIEKTHKREIDRERPTYTCKHIYIVNLKHITLNCALLFPRSWLRCRRRRRRLLLLLLLPNAATVRTRVEKFCFAASLVPIRREFFFIFNFECLWINAALFYFILLLFLVFLFVALVLCSMFSAANGKIKARLQHWPPSHLAHTHTLTSCRLLCSCRHTTRMRIIMTAQRRRCAAY